MTRSLTIYLFLSETEMDRRLQNHSNRSQIPSGFCSRELRLHETAVVGFQPSLKGRVLVVKATQYHRLFVSTHEK